MILSHISDSARYEALHPLFKKVFDYVKANDLLHAPAGRIVLDGDALFINVCEANLVTAEAQKLEVHQKYIDIHFPLSGEEIVGWKHLSGLGESEAPLTQKMTLHFMLRNLLRTIRCSQASSILCIPRMPMRL